MADSTAHPSWQSTEDAFTFDPNAPNHIPRAWERTPKSPIASRHKGRKIWKRYEGPSQGQVAGLEGSVLGSEESRPVLGDATNTPRPVKRMRLKDVSDGGRGGKENRTAQYFAMLHDKVQGTPKRKQASRRSLILDRPAVEVKEAGDGSSETPDTSNDNVQQDSLRASESPVLDDVRGLLASIQDTVEPDPHSSYSEQVMASEDDAASRAEVAQSTEDATDTDTHSENPALDVAPKFLDTADHIEEEVEAGANLSSAQLVEAVNDDVEETAEAEKDAKVEKASNDAAFNNVALEASSPAKRETTDHTPSNPAVAVGTEQSPAATREVTPNLSRTPTTEGGNVVASSPSPAFSPIIPEVLASTVSLNSPETTVPHAEPMASREPVTPKPSSTLKLPQPTGLLRAESPGQSPQIGTSLLRRESLRRKESPDKKSSRKARSPKKRDTLSKRDTLQEREILQKVISKISPEQSIEDVDNGVITTPSPDAEALQENAEKAEKVEKADLEDSHNMKAEDPTADSTESVLSTPNEEKFKNKDLHRALEAIKAYESPKKTETSGSSVTVSADHIQATKALDDADESIAKMEIDEAVYALETDKETDSSNRKTRSGGRFSDDTSMLKEFLNRAQAKKAAKTPILSVPDLSDAPKPQVSPRRSPRKALGSHDGNALILRKQRDILNRPATPPGKPKLDARDSDEIDEICEEVTSCRRSTRTRLPAPSKTPPGAPSFIPVRRADGADPVVLHKSQAQELAMVTRANTRRNKGQSKPPLLALQDLPAATTEVARITKQRAESAKTVGWAEKLASYQDAKDADEAEETRPKVRRMRGLGAANGTPAPKRTTAVVSTSNGTPAPKRRGRVQ